MAQYPVFPLWTDAYLADTTHLSTIEHGAYLLLLIAMWRTPSKSLPNDDKLLAKFAHLGNRQWTRMRPTLIEFFDVTPTVIRQGRLTDEATAVRQRSHLASNSAKARWLKNKPSGDAVAMPGPCYPNPNPNLTKKGSIGAGAPIEPKESLPLPSPPKAKPKGKTAYRPPSEKVFTWAAAKEGLTREETERLIAGHHDWALKNDKRFTDWDAAARSWVRGRHKFATNGTGPNQGQGSRGDQIHRAVERWVADGNRH